MLQRASFSGGRLRLVATRINPSRDRELRRPAREESIVVLAKRDAGALKFPQRSDSEADEQRYQTLSIQTVY